MLADGASRLLLEPFGDALVVVEMLTLGQFGDERVVAEFIVADDALVCVGEIFGIVVVLPNQVLFLHLGDHPLVDVVYSAEVAIDDPVPNWTLASLRDLLRSPSTIATSTSNIKKQKKITSRTNTLAKTTRRNLHCQSSVAISKVKYSCRTE